MAFVDGGLGRDALLAEKAVLIDSATGILDLLEITREIIAGLLRRESDTTHRDKTLAMVTRYFMTVMNSQGLPAPEKLAKLKLFSREICAIVVAERGVIAKTAAIGGRREVDRDPEAVAGLHPTRMVALEALAEETADAPATAAGDGGLAVTADRIVGLDSDGLMAGADPTAVAIVTPPPPRPCEDFPTLFAESIGHRIAAVTCFFQRHNPSVERELPRPFLLSPAFADRLIGFVKADLVPRMMAGSRNIAMLGSSRPWHGATAKDFWEVVAANDQARNAIAAAWEAAWGDYRQRREMRDGRPVLVASPSLRDLRHRLAPRAGEFTVPPIRNTEIDLFLSMLLDFDLHRIENNWRKLRQLYEQEMDRRVYQDKARAGALRDSILDAFDALPDMTGDFLALLCYFCFPHVDLHFLDRFTHNKGSTVAERRRRVPYLMQFLADDRVPHVLLRENRERHERESPAPRSMARR